MCVYTQVTTHTYILLCCQLRQPGSNEHTGPRTLVSDTILQSQAPGLLGQRLIYDQGGKYARWAGHLVLPEGKEEEGEREEEGRGGGRKEEGRNK